MHHKMRPSQPQAKPLRSPAKLLLGASAFSFLLFSNSGVLAEDFCRQPELNVNGLSKHFYESNYSRREGWNEVNSGLGVTCQLDDLGQWNREFEVGFLKNSHRKTSLYGAYGVYYTVNSVMSVGIRFMVASGYKSYVRTNGIIGGPLPTLKLHLGNAVTLNLSVAPKAKSFVFASVGLGF